MADITGPGDKGSTQGQIQTPMCKENVDNQGDGKVHSYKNTMNIGSTSSSNTIEGPGAKGKWNTQIDITGSNTNTGKY